MILSVRVNNFLVYSNDVELSMKADMRIKKFSSNVYNNKKFNVLKSICIYGPNNSGKTGLIRAINSIKNVLLGLPAEVFTNIFTNDKTCSLGISFINDDGRAFSYDFKFDSEIANNYRKAFKFECLKELFIDKYGNYKEKKLFIRDVDNGVYEFDGDKELENVLKIVSNDNILIYTINSNKYAIVDEYKSMLRNFATKIEILDMNNIPLNKTIDVLKKDGKIRNKTVELIKLSDLEIEDFKYLKNSSSQGKNVSDEFGKLDPREEVLKSVVSFDDMYRLVSVHRGKAVQSMFFDSTGTKKIVAVASYIVDALETGKTLVIDELDSSLHFKLTRAIVALFNNDLNRNSQLIFTAHDITLLDCKKLFRKDQVWFASKDEDNEYLYSLADFTSHEDKTRSESDLIEKYNLGVFGAIPDPDLISILLSKEENGGDDINE